MAVTGLKRGDILQSDATKIIFGVNTEGYNDAGFAGLVASLGMDLTGPTELGHVRTWEQPDTGRTFYAITVHSLDREPGWSKAVDAVTTALAATFDADTVAASVLMGAGFVGAMQGAPVEAISDAFDKADGTYTLWTL
jgi:hypothetical protein